MGYKNTSILVDVPQVYSMSVTVWNTVQENEHIYIVTRGTNTHKQFQLL